jgi:hypothetical protein
VIYLGVESVSRAEFSSEFSSVSSERVQSSELEFGELKSWGVVGRLSGIVFGEEVRN